MHTYIKAHNEVLWTVGHYTFDGDEHYSSDARFVPMKDFTDEWKAAAYVNYLNGGDGKIYPI